MKKLLLLLLASLLSLLSFGQSSNYCGGEVRHLGLPAEIASAIFLTITHVDSVSMEVIIESANTDRVDFLLLNVNSGGAMVSDQDTSVAGQIKRSISWATAPDSVELNVLWSKESFAGNWQLMATPFQVPFQASCAAIGNLSPPDLPITFEDSTVDYDLTDFNGNISQIVVDPTDPSNMVAESIKDSTATSAAGTSVGDSGLVRLIPFTDLNTKIRLRVWSPDAGTPVRLKVEDSNNGNISVETEDTTTLAMQWDTLEFDFSNAITGPALDTANAYNKISIFFDFGNTGANAGRKTYYWDDIELLESGPRSPYCETESFHLMDSTQLASAILLTIKNEGSTSMMVEVESSNSDPVDFLLVTGASGASISPPNTSVPGRISVTLTWTAPPMDVTLNVLWSKNSFGGNWQLDPIDITLPFTSTCPPPAPRLAKPDLPITFEDSTVDYNLADFSGTASQIVVDPTDPGNLVVETIRTTASSVFAGTSAGDLGLENPVPFASDKVRMQVRVWSPLAGIPVRLKVENAAMASISAETEDTTTVAMQWETLTFDFNRPAPNTGLINPANTYDKVVIFFNFGVDGMTAGQQTFYWDDVSFVDSSIVIVKPDLPLTFEDTTLDYNLLDFAGAASHVTIDPTDPNNRVVETLRTDGAEVFAGTTAGAIGLENPIPFGQGKTSMSVRVWSPAAGIPLRLKVENIFNGGIRAETQEETTEAMQWETIFFDLSQTVAGTPDFDLVNTYDKVSIFFNFGAEGATVGAQTYYWDDVEFVDSVIINFKPELPITFEDSTLDYDIEDFGGSASQIVVDPTDPDNTVVETLRTDAAETFAGTTAGANGLETPIPFTPTETFMSVDVWSPSAGIPVRLKVENAGDKTVSVETEDTTTLAMQWETLVFDFLNEAMGTAAFNVNSTYDKASIFFNFGARGADVGAQTYYWDNMVFGDSSAVNLTSAFFPRVLLYPNPAQDLLNIELSEMTAQPVRVEMYDMEGRMIRSINMKERQARIVVGDLPRGLYLMKINGEPGQLYRKIILGN